MFKHYFCGCTAIVEEYYVNHIFFLITTVLYIGVYAALLVLLKQSSNFHYFLVKIIDLTFYKTTTGYCAIER